MREESAGVTTVRKWLGGEDTCSIRRRAALGKEVDCCGAMVAHHGWRRMWTAVGVDGGWSWGGAGGTWWFGA